MSYHNFDDDLMSDLPSCVFGTGQHMTPIENMNNLGTSVGIPTTNSRNPCNMTLLQRSSTSICPIPPANLQHHQYNQMPHHHHHHSGRLFLKTSQNDEISLGELSNHVKVTRRFTANIISLKTRILN